MRFKQWLEDSAASGSEYGNNPDPLDNGLQRPQYGGGPGPHSEKADSMFLGSKYMDKENDNQILFYNRDREQYGFLSNFHPAQFELDGQTWPTVEHYYMSQKSSNDAYRQEIIRAETPGRAKRLGDSRMNDPKQAKQSLFRKGYNLVDNWDKSKSQVMLKAIHAKFTQNMDLKQALLETGDAELIEDSPSDSYWGIGNGSGQNMLGKILMRIRSELRRGDKIRGN